MNRILYVAATAGTLAKLATTADARPGGFGSGGLAGSGFRDAGPAGGGLRGGIGSDGFRGVGAGNGAVGSGSDNRAGGLRSGFAGDRNGIRGGRRHFGSRRGFGYGALGFGTGLAVGYGLGSDYGYYGYEEGYPYDGYAPASVTEDPGVAAEGEQDTACSRFKSYDPRSDTYLGKDGRRNSCR